MKGLLRPWPLAAILLTVLVAGGAYFWWSHRMVPPAEMASYLPAGDAVVAYLDVSALRQGGLLNRIAPAQASEEQEYQRFVKDTGFNYKQDLDAVLVQWQGVRTYLVARGRFSWSQLSRYAVAHNGKCESGFCRMPGSVAGRQLSFYSLRPNLIAFASGPDEFGASNIVKREQGGASLEMPPQPVWVSISPYFLQNTANYPAGLKLFGKILDQAKQITLTLGPEGQRFALQLNAAFATTAEAELAKAQLNEVTKTLKQMIVLEKQAPNPGDLSGVLTAGSFRTEQNRTYGTWPIEPAFLENLTAEAKAK